MTIYQFKPTYLYIKQHSVTGMLYFGKFSTIDPKKTVEKYLGSGKYWKAHIKKHGIEHVETLWYCLFLDQESLTEFALSFSEQLNIVESDEWANLTVENGVGGGCRCSEETKAKLSESMRGRPKSEDHKKKISSSKIGKPGNSAFAGKVHSAETKQRMSDSQKAVVRHSLSESTKSKISEKAVGMVTAYDLIDGKFVKIHRDIFQHSRDRYVGMKSKLIPR